MGGSREHQGLDCAQPAAPLEKAVSCPRWVTPVKEGVSGKTLFSSRRRIKDVLEKEC
jgi:hypothetical protein